MDRVNVGMHVDIRRSDGRVHTAIISEVRKESQSVTVEWFENVRFYEFFAIIESNKCFGLEGETKGKEIDLKALLAINPVLAIPVAEAFAEGSRNGLSNHSRQQISTAFGNRRSMIVGQVSQSCETDLAKALLDQPNDTARVSMHFSKNVTQKQRINLDTTSLKGFKGADLESLDAISLKGTQQQHQQHQQQQSKSSTVQEIERLQRNREERRAQLAMQFIPLSMACLPPYATFNICCEFNLLLFLFFKKEVKKQKEQQKNIDPGNPNWQFLSMIRDYQSQIDFRPLKMTDQVTDNRICVCVRKRPLNRKEIMKKEIEVITIPNRDHLIVHQPQVKVDLTKYLDNQKFRFDYTFDDNVTNEMVYKFTAQPLVKTIFEQGFATCFAYGQTGSGKTHTMGGDFSGKAQDCSKGVYALTAADVFKMLHKEYKRQNLHVYCSFFEIYGGKVFDLIGNKAMLRVLEDGKKEVQIIGLQEILVKDEKDVLDLIKKGNEVRTAGTTSANANSSRSHAVFQIILRKKSEKHGLGRMWGKFSLIDLAGNERGVDTISSDRQTRMEGAEINKSLLALKECIRAMGRNSVHVPFRASKLTLVLRDSFIGSNAKTCMIAMISPGMSSCEHTLNTLRYADRVKELGADEGSNIPMEDDELMLANDDDDFDLIQSTNMGMSEEAYKMQRTLQSVARSEERSLDELTSIFEESDKVKSDIMLLLNRASKVEYDMEGFVIDLDKFVTQQIEKYMRLRG
ncbi:unnamed protein product [Dracunculus medinensis]|uniref:Kinesin-like protein n=1 Tax=Dracunculus medinensis TaxID=318479 RepID=A0A0N4UL70_DRAME|nr:unnamed protein product [Dracunculus medinensis]